MGPLFVWASYLCHIRFNHVWLTLSTLHQFFYLHRIWSSSCAASVSLRSLFSVNNCAGRQTCHRMNELLPQVSTSIHLLDASMMAKFAPHLSQAQLYSRNSEPINILKRKRTLHLFRFCGKMQCFYLCSIQHACLSCADGTTQVIYLLTINL